MQSSGWFQFTNIMDIIFTFKMFFQCLGKSRYYTSFSYSVSLTLWPTEALIFSIWQVFFCLKWLVPVLWPEWQGIHLNFKIQFYFLYLLGQLFLGGHTICLHDQIPFVWIIPSWSPFLPSHVYSSKLISKLMCYIHMFYDLPFCLSCCISNIYYFSMPSLS